MSIVLKTVAVLSLVEGVVGSWGWGSCQGNNISYGVNKGVDFEPERYTGKWYEIKYDKDFLFEQGSECTVAYYTSRPTELIYKVGVNNSSVNKADGKLSDSYVFGIGTDITASKARFEADGNGYV